MSGRPSTCPPSSPLASTQISRQSIANSSTPENPPSSPSQPSCESSSSSPTHCSKQTACGPIPPLDHHGYSNCQEATPGGTRSGFVIKSCLAVRVEGEFTNDRSNCRGRESANIFRCPVFGLAASACKGLACLNRPQHSVRWGDAAFQTCHCDCR